MEQNKIEQLLAMQTRAVGLDLVGAVLSIFAEDLSARHYSYHDIRSFFDVLRVALRRLGHEEAAVRIDELVTKVRGAPPLVDVSKLDIHAIRSNLDALQHLVRQASKETADLQEERDRLRHAIGQAAAKLRRSPSLGSYEALPILDAALNPKPAGDTGKDQPHE